MHTGPGCQSKIKFWGQWAGLIKICPAYHHDHRSHNKRMKIVPDSLQQSYFTSSKEKCIICTYSTKSHEQHAGCKCFWSNASQSSATISFPPVYLRPSLRCFVSMKTLWRYSRVQDAWISNKLHSATHTHDTFIRRHLIWRGKNKIRFLTSSENPSSPYLNFLHSKNNSFLHSTPLHTPHHTTHP